MSTLPLAPAASPSLLQASAHRAGPGRNRLPAWLQSPAIAPLMALLLASLLLVPLGGDRWVADHLYAAEGGSWAWRDSVVLTRVLHAGGKALSTLAWLGVCAMAMRAGIDPCRKSLRRPVLALLLSVAISTLLVSALKHLTRMDCPWDATIYGGSHPYFTLLQARPAGIRPSGCFPAGQASAGYAWVALYFFFASVRPAWRRTGLAIGIVSGAVLGIAQQLRGAHYLSHDVWTLAICWFVALGVHRFSVHLAHRDATDEIRGDAATLHADGLAGDCEA